MSREKKYYVGGKGIFVGKLINQVQGLCQEILRFNGVFFFGMLFNVFNFIGREDLMFYNFVFFRKDLYLLLVIYYIIIMNYYKYIIYN